jgi:hypothetical protein
MDAERREAADGGYLQIVGVCLEVVSHEENMIAFNRCDLYFPKEIDRPCQSECRTRLDNQRTSVVRFDKRSDVIVAAWIVSLGVAVILGFVAGRNW